MAITNGQVQTDIASPPSSSPRKSKVSNRTVGLILVLAIAAVITFSVWYIIWYKAHS